MPGHDYARPIDLGLLLARGLFRLFDLVGFEHEGFLPKGTEVTDIFSPHENFVAGGTPRTSGRIGTRAANPHEKAGDPRIGAA